MSTASFTSTVRSIGYRLFRVGRVAAISVAIYKCGYQAGLSSVINDPIGTNKTLMNMVLSTMGATGESDNPVMKRRCRVVGKRVVVSAKDYCLQKYAVAKNELKAGNGQEDEVEKWKEAVHILSNHEWKFIVINSPTVNAFVNHLLPGKVFVHEGLFNEVKPTDDELALIISHEISHIIHQHGQASSNMTMIAGIVQLVLFSFVDPSGALPFLFDIIIKQFGTVMENYYSRENETEADLTGIEIAAHACFETRDSHEVFGRLSSGDHYWNSTHPSGESRVAYMLEASGIFNPEVLGDKCKKMKGFLEEVKGLLRGSR